MPEASPLAPTEPVPPPLPSAAFEAPPPVPAPAMPPPVRPAPTKPPVKGANFPPPPGLAKKPGAPAAAATPKPAVQEKPKTNVALFGLLALVIGGAAFVYFADPFGLFAPAPAPAPVAPPPPPTPVVEQPAPKDPDPAPVVTEPEPTPEPAIETVPEEPPPPPPPPPPLPEVTNAISALKVSGARMNTSGGIIMLGPRVYNAGEVINAELGITFVGFTEGTFTFRDERGALYQRRF